MTAKIIEELLKEEVMERALRSDRLECRLGAGYPCLRREQQGRRQKARMQKIPFRKGKTPERCGRGE